MKLTADHTTIKTANDSQGGWSGRAAEILKEISDKYGPPDEKNNHYATWFNNGPWKKTVVQTQGIPHNFPMPHEDHLMQTVDFSVPPEKFSELAAYDGSVIVDRTPGEISARCDKEEANFLALNLAVDIIHDRKSVEEAREFYHRVMVDKELDDDYTSELLFTSKPGAFTDAPLEEDSE